MSNTHQRQPPGRKPLLGESPADRIYEAALACIDAAGFAKTSMDDIARRAGVSRPTIYTYFTSKQDLVLEILVRQADLQLAAMVEQTNDRHGLDRVVHAADLGVRASRQNPYYRSFIAGSRGTAWTLAALRQDRFRDLERNYWSPLLTDAIDRAELRNDQPVAELVDWIVFQQFAIATHAEALGWDDGHVTNHIHLYLRSALQPPRDRSGT